MTPEILNAPEACKAQKIAIIDLGSNSFHMVIVEKDALGYVNILHREKQKVQLRSGLDEHSCQLDPDSKERALNCLEQFSIALEQFEVEHVDAVGTYTLRAAQEAQDTQDFLQLASEVLTFPIRIISGEEEARLIYVGASQKRDLSSKHLIIDIGGGSTELIIGENNKILSLASLPMGSVSFQEKFFKDFKLTQENFSSAIDASRKLAASIKSQFLSLGWRHALGSSGTIQAVFSIIRSLTPGETEISLNQLEVIARRMVYMGEVNLINFEALRDDRKNIIAGGLCVLLGLFYELRISSMGLSKGALREGLLCELFFRLDQQKNS